MNSFPVPDGQSCFRPRSSTAHLHGPVLVMGTSWHALLMEHTPWPQNFNAACSTVPQFQRQKHKRRSPLACLIPPSMCSRVESRCAHSFNPPHTTSSTSLPTLEMQHTRRRPAHADLSSCQESARIAVYSGRWSVAVRPQHP